MSAKNFPTRLILEIMILHEIPQQVAQAAFQSENWEMLGLICHVFPGYEKQDFPYLALPGSAKELLVPELRRQFPNLINFDLAIIKDRKSWEGILVTQIATIGTELCVLCSASQARAA